MKKKLLLFLVAVCLLVVSFLAVTPLFVFQKPIFADQLEDLQKQIAEYEKQVEELGKQKNSLSQQITLMDKQIQVATLKISQTETQIKTLEQEIGVLSGKIVRLNDSLNYLSKVLLSRVAESYKQGKVDSLTLLLSSKNFSQFVSNLKYLQLVQLHDREMLLSMETTRTSYDDQKKLKEKAQADLQKLQKQLVTQKQQLNSQIADRKRLLDETKGKEANYQKLLAKAKAEIASLKGFTEGQKGGILPPQQSPDGWFYSQRDERWATNTIGYSQEKIFDVGCLISDIAMIFTFYGDRKTPADIANNSSYFFSRTAYMNSPWPAPAGKTPILLSDLNAVNGELGSGRPVIVHLNLGGDGHFVVLKSKDGDNYIMHDPWNGYDLKFNDYYKLASIDKRVVYK